MEPIEPEFVQPSTSYRDRARERREGINKDFELDPDDLRYSNPTLDESSRHREGREELNDDQQQADLDEEKERRLQQIEESKYLGGDVSHTHLVKGLDFALLEKVRNDQKLAEKLAGDKDDIVFHNGGDSDSEEEEFRTEAILAASRSSSSKRQLIDLEKLKKGQSTEIIQCRTAIARRILNVLDEKWPDKSELFLPGRMSYIIPIGEECEDTSVTTVLRSKADASVSNDGNMETDFALDQLVNILSKIKRGQLNTQNSDALKKSRDWDSRTGDLTNEYDY